MKKKIKQLIHKDNQQKNFKNDYRTMWQIAGNEGERRLKKDLDK